MDPPSPIMHTVRQMEKISQGFSNIGPHIHPTPRSVILGVVGSRGMAKCRHGAGGDKGMEQVHPCPCRVVEILILRSSTTLGCLFGRQGPGAFGHPRGGVRGRGAPKASSDEIPKGELHDTVNQTADGECASQHCTDLHPATQPSGITGVQEKPHKEENINTNRTQRKHGRGKGETHQHTPTTERRAFSKNAHTLSSTHAHTFPAHTHCQTHTQIHYQAHTNTHTHIHTKTKTITIKITQKACMCMKTNESINTNTLSHSTSSGTKE